MALNDIDAQCRSCGHTFRQAPKRTFLGFQRLKCPSCGKDVIHPLTKGYRITYWVIVAWMALRLLSALSRGGIAVPGLMGLAVIIGLVRDRRIRNEVASFREPV